MINDKIIIKKKVIIKFGISRTWIRNEIINSRYFKRKIEINSLR